ncbi:hypothetical protein [Salipiger sp. PrR002]|uniref:hypothetical protein n=1 Tax=Salipiger sp. PrR002 TaxID=2706489 RepID=UPI00194266CF|nr:hypothetical protein [Salipiger sp. PrR002]
MTLEASPASGGGTETQSHVFHRRLHDFSESIEHALTALLLVAPGRALPRLFADLTWTQLAVALLLLLIIRPLAGWLALPGTGLRRLDRAVMAIYGAWLNLLPRLCSEPCGVCR